MAQMMEYNTILNYNSDGLFKKLQTVKPLKKAKYMKIL